MVRYVLLLFSVVFMACALLQLNSPPVKAFDKTGCEMDCQKCHTITTQDVKEILVSLKAPEAEILKIQASPLKGLWEVSINNKGKPGLFYVDFSKTFIVSGSVVEVKTGKNKHDRDDDKDNDKEKKNRKHKDHGKRKKYQVRRNF